jgi:hypothetical protein
VRFSCAASAGQKQQMLVFDTYYYQVGKKIDGTGIGSNNIIIGTNISLPNNTTNGINLGWCFILEHMQQQQITQVLLRKQLVR